MTLHDKQLLEAAKSDYNQAMHGLFGPKWRTISKILKVYNIPEDEEIREELKNESLKFYR